MKLWQFVLLMLGNAVVQSALAIFLVNHHVFG